MPEWLIQIFLVGAVYGGIRADLKNIHASIASVKEVASKAHERIDAILNK